jgi:hypothetical protein
MSTHQYGHNRTRGGTPFFGGADRITLACDLYLSPNDLGGVVTELSGRGRAWRTLRARVIAEETVCGICGGWVDKTLVNPHPRAPQVDHIIPVKLAPQLVMVRSNLRLVHRVCNLRRGTAGVAKRRPAGRRATPPVFGPLSSSSFTTSRKW